MDVGVSLSRRAVAVTLTVVVAVLIAYTMYFNLNPSILLELDPLTIAIAVATTTLSIVSTGIRLGKIHAIAYSRSLSVKDYYSARVLGNLVALLTPSSGGGEPARAYYLHLKTGDGLAGLFAVAVYEVYVDVIVTNVLAIMFSLYFLPLSIPVLLVSLGTIAIWTLLVLGLCREGLFNRIVVSFVERLPPQIASGYDEFIRVFKKLVSKTLSIDFIPITLYTIAAYMFNALTIYFISKPLVGGVPLLNALTGYVFSLALGGLPSPGGAGTVEYGLSISLDPRVVLATRVFMFVYMVVAGSLVLLSLKKSR